MLTPLRLVLGIALVLLASWCTYSLALLREWPLVVACAGFPAVALGYAALQAKRGHDRTADEIISWAFAAVVVFSIFTDTVAGLVQDCAAP